MGAAFCVKNIAEAECATREHVSARKRAPLALQRASSTQRGQLLDVCGMPCHHALRKTAKSKWLQANCGAVQVELVCLQNTAQSGPHFGARNVGPKRGAAEAARYPS